MTVWDVVVYDGKKPASILDGGYYPTDAVQAIRFAENTRYMLGITSAPIVTFPTRHEAYEWLETAPSDAIAIHSFDWDEENW